LSGRDAGFEVVAGVLSLAFALTVTITLLVCLVSGGSLWVYEDNPWILNFEIGLGFISLWLIGERLWFDIMVLRHYRLYHCNWLPCGDNMGGWCMREDEDEIRECKRCMRELWGREV